MADICVCSHHRSLAALRNDPEFAALLGRPGFLIELRLDQYADLDPENLRAALAQFSAQAIVTYRRPDEGGVRAQVEDAERLRYLQQAADLGARYIDVEFTLPQILHVATPVKILS